MRHKVMPWLIAGLVLAACSSAPPRPPVSDGDGGVRQGPVVRSTFGSLCHFLAALDLLEEANAGNRSIEPLLRYAQTHGPSAARTPLSRMVDELRVGDTTAILTITTHVANECRARRLAVPTIR